MITLFNKFTSGKIQVRNGNSRNLVWGKRSTVGQKMIYTIGRWRPCRANINQINCTFARRKGLAVAMSEGISRIKGFRLKNAILYSYLRDTRFVTLTCLLIGISMWRYDVPTLLFQKTEALKSPDLGLLVGVMKDTYVNKMCSTHAVPSPCECGEPLNSAARYMYPPESIDPLHIDKKPTKRAIAFHVATLIIAMALAESVTPSGVMM